MTTFQDLAAGQSWSLKNSNLDETRLVIGLTEYFGDVPAVHVSLINIGRVRDREGKLCGGTIIHSCFQADVVLSAIETLDTDVGEVPVRFEQALDAWKKAGRTPTDEPPIELIARALDILETGYRKQ